MVRWQVPEAAAGAVADYWALMICSQIDAAAVVAVAEQWALTICSDVAEAVDSFLRFPTKN